MTVDDSNITGPPKVSVLFKITHLYCYVPGVTRRLRKPTSWLASNKLCLKFNKSI